MGSDLAPNEMPIRQVQVDTFWIDESEVTVAEYAACEAAAVCATPQPDAFCNWGVEGRDDHPVNCVTWFDAEAYCGWVDGGTKRLPTEAEWEKAARSADARMYPWGDAPAPNCVHAVMDDGGWGCGQSSTWLVDSKLPGDSPYGAHDMAGNVWEWVADWYASTYDPMDTDNPTGPPMGTQRILRGGSWGDNYPGYFRTSARITVVPSYFINNVGFRCAL